MIWLSTFQNISWQIEWRGQGQKLILSNTLEIEQTSQTSQTSHDGDKVLENRDWVHVFEACLWEGQKKNVKAELLQTTRIVSKSSPCATHREKTWKIRNWLNHRLSMFWFTYFQVSNISNLDPRVYSVVWDSCDNSDFGASQCAQASSEEKWCVAINLKWQYTWLKHL